MDSDLEPQLSLTTVASNSEAKPLEDIQNADYDEVKSAVDDVSIAEIMPEVLESLPPPPPPPPAPIAALLSGDTEEDAAAKKSARKARLKEARNIRFSIGESQHNMPSKESKMGKQSSLYQDYLPQDLLTDDLSATAISTPTRYDHDDASLELDELSIPDIKVEEDEVERLLNEDSEDDEDDERPSIKGDTISAKKFFLENFEIPDFDDISDDDVVIVSEKKKSVVSMAASSSQFLEDKGRFTDPLTGETISSESSSSTESSEPPVVLSSTMSSVEDDLLDLESLKSVKAEIKEEEDAEALFHRFESSFAGALDPIETVDIGKIKAKMQVTQITTDFVNELIRNVVTTAEGIKEDLRFNRSIDKSKLHDNLTELVAQYLIEKNVNDYLNTKMVEYYKRLKNDRAFTKLSAEMHEKERDRYMEALYKLDHNLIVMASSKKKTAYLLSSVLMDLSYLENICRNSEEMLYEKMLEVLGNRSEYLRRITDRELRLMSVKRNEISDTRLFLITRKHTLARITDKIHKLEQINEDISMDDFITLQNQVAALNKKIEERNIDLKKARVSYQSSLHMAHHNREKIQMTSARLVLRKIDLQKVQERQRELREKLYNVKLERQKMRKLNSDLTYQGGLLALPSLMYDYDATVQRVAIGQANVNELRETHARITQRIAELEIIVGKSASIVM